MAVPADISVITEVERFDALAGEWDALARSVARPTPFQAHAWLSARWRFDAERAAVVVARRGDRIVAALPLAIGAAPLSTGSFLAGNYIGSDLMLATDEPLDTARLLLRALGRTGASHLELSGLSERTVLEAAGERPLRGVEESGAAWLDLSDGWDATYERQVNARGRKEHRRRMSRMREAGTVEFTTARTKDELLRDIEIAFDLHDLRWRTRGGDADRSGFTSRKDFHRAALTGLADADIPRILLLKLDGKPIAFEYTLLYEGTVFGHRVSFDSAYAAFAPGLHVMLHALALASEEGARAATFLRGLEPYKLQLTDRTEPILWAACEPQSALGTAAVHTRRALKAARGRAKQVSWLKTTYHRALRARS